MSMAQGNDPPTPPASSFASEVPDELLRDRLLTTSVVKIQLLRLAMRGFNATEAAKVVGVSAQTARSHYADPEFRSAVAAKVDAAFADIDEAFVRKRKSLHEMIEEQAYRSCEDLIEMLDSPDLHPSLRAKINQDFLDRVEESATVQRAVKLEPADLRRAAQVAEEMDNVIQLRRKPA